MAVGTQEREADDEQESKTPYDASKPQYTRKKKDPETCINSCEKDENGHHLGSARYILWVSRSQHLSTTLIIFAKIQICKFHNKKKRQSH